MKRTKLSAFVRREQSTHDADKARDERQIILDALSTWIRQRPGLEYGNYGDPTSYRSELRGITKDLHHARALLAYVRPRESITADMLKAAFKSGFSGRLSWVETYRCTNCKTRYGTEERSVCTNCNQDAVRSEGHRLDYCTGQYWPTEYRRAVCAVLASAIWYWWREHCMPKGVLMHNSETGETLERYQGLRAGDWLRRNAQREFGSSVAKRWFN